MTGNRYAAYDDYGLHHKAEHLYERRAVPARRRALYDLICAPFMREKHRRTFTHRAFLQDVNLALDAAGEERPPNLCQEVHCSLLAAILGELATVIPPELPGVLARAGREDQAIGLAELVQDPLQRCRAYLAVSEALIEKHDRVRAADLLERALVATRGKWRDASRERYERLESSAWSRGYDVDAYADVMARDMEPMWSPEAAVADVARLLVRAGAVERAVQVAQAIEKRYARGEACAGVFAALLQEQALAQAQALAGRVEDWVQAGLCVELAGFLAGEGAVEEALQIAHSLEDAQRQARALYRVVEALLARHAVKQAWQVARTIAEDDTYSLAMTTVALAEAASRPRVALDLLDDALSKGTGIDVTIQASLVYAAVGKEEELMAMTARAAQAVYQMWGWNDIRSALKEMARALAHVVMGAGEEAALEIVAYLEDERQVAWTLGWTACELAQWEKPDLALDLAWEALAWARAYKKGNILRPVIEALAPALNLAQAFDVLDTVGDGDDRAQLMIGFAEGWSGVGAHDRAAAMADEALELLEWSGCAFRHDGALSAIALTLAHLGKAARARRVVGDLASDRNLARTREAVEREAAGAGAVHRATGTGAETTAPAGRARTGATQVDVLEDLDALPTLESYQIESAVRRLVPALVGTGQLAQSLEPLLQAIERLSFPEDRAEVLADVAGALAEDGESELAMTVAHRAFSIMPTKYHIYGRYDAPASLARENMAETVGKVAHALARTGDAEGAFQALRYLEEEMNRDDFRDGVLGEIVRGLAQGGEVDRAVAETRRIKELEKRAGALGDIAHIVHLSEDPQRALDVWRMALHTARHTASDEVLRAIEKGAALLGAVDEGETLWRTYETIVSLEGWWERP